MKEQDNLLMSLHIEDVKLMKEQKLEEIAKLKKQDKPDEVVLKILALDKQVETIDFYIKKRGGK